MLYMLSSVKITGGAVLAHNLAGDAGDNGITILAQQNSAPSYYLLSVYTEYQLPYYTQLCWASVASAVINYLTNETTTMVGLAQTEFGSNNIRAIPRNGIKNPRHLPVSAKSVENGCFFFALATRIRLPDSVCQPESGLPAQTSYSVLRSVFADLGIVFFGIAIVPLPRQKHVLPLLGRTIFRVLCA